MDKEKLVIVGIGSLTPNIVDFVKRYDLFDIVGFSVDKKYIIEEYDGLPVYPLEDIEKYINKDEVKIFISISWYNYLNKYKKEKYDYLAKRGFHFANLVSPTAQISTKHIGEGNWFCDYSYVGYDAVIGNNNVFGTFCLVGHNSIIGHHNALVGRSTIAGDVNIGDRNYFGLCSTVFNELSIGNCCIIGGGSVVNRSLPDYSQVFVPESKYRKGTERVNEFIISAKAKEMMKTINS